MARKLGAQAFYRPAARPDPRPAKIENRGQAGEQLRLKFDAPQPLADIFPDAYK